MKEVTLFESFVIRKGKSTIENCLEEIRNGTYKTLIENVRKINIEKGKEEADKLKKHLIAFTPSGTFETRRRIEAITVYNQCIILDFDDISANYLEEAKNNAILAPYTLGAFISPRGTGLKIIVQVNTEVSDHVLAFSKLAEYYEEALNETVDPSGKDCSRLCFMSYDPEAYYNPEALVFEIQKEEQVSKEEETKLSDDELFQKLIDFTNQKSTYTEGNRNNYIHLLACNCNRNGLSKHFTESKILQEFNLDEKETIATIKSAFENNAADFNKYSDSAKIANFANIATSAKQNTVKEQLDALTSMPVIPEEVYSNLPQLLKKGSEAFVDDERKKDVYLTSAITIISGCLPNVFGIYHQERMFPNLFSFIIAPAANGKGVLKNAKRMADKYHNKLCSQSLHSKQEFENEMIKYKAECSKLKKGEEPPEKPVEPSFKRVFIPADTSQAMLVKMINDNDGKGIICETEADTMSGANKQDWGNYSHIMRGAFHHEKVSLARKANNEVLEIQEPKMSVSLSGTPKQVPKLIASAEDGLFSRFMFYAFRSPIIWRSPAPQENGIVYNDHFDRLADEVVEITNLLEQYPTEIKLTKEQWEKFNAEFAYLLEQSVMFNTDDVAGVVYRLGLITFRICMQFTALRKFEDGDTSREVFCSDQDFDTAIILSNIYLEHSIMMFNNLSQSGEEIKYKLPANKQRLLDMLPNRFRRKEAIEKGKKIDLKERTVDALLQKLVPDVLEKIKDGYYEKTNPTN